MSHYYNVTRKCSIMAQKPRFTIFLTPGQALGAYAITGIFRTVGIVFAISGLLSFIIITISILRGQPGFLLIGIFPIPVFLLVILFFPGIGPITLAIKKNRKRTAEIQYQRQQQQVMFQQWQQQKQWVEYQQFLAWKQQQSQR